MASVDTQYQAIQKSIYMEIQISRFSFFECWFKKTNSVVRTREKMRFDRFFSVLMCRIQSHTAPAFLLAHFLLTPCQRKSQIITLIDLLKSLTLAKRIVVNTTSESILCDSCKGAIILIGGHYEDLVLLFLFMGIFPVKKK